MYPEENLNRLCQLALFGITDVDSREVFRDLQEELGLKIEAHVECFTNIWEDRFYFVRTNLWGHRFHWPTTQEEQISSKERPQDFFFRAVASTLLFSLWDTAHEQGRGGLLNPYPWPIVRKAIPEKSFETIKRLMEAYPVSARRWCKAPEEGGCACVGCVRWPAPSTVRGDPEGRAFPNPEDRLTEEEVKRYLKIFPPPPPTPPQIIEFDRLSSGPWAEKE